MMFANFCYLILGLGATLVGTLSLGFGVDCWVTSFVIGFANVYSMACSWNAQNAAFRRAPSRSQSRFLNFRIELGVCFNYCFSPPP